MKPFRQLVREMNESKIYKRNFSDLKKSFFRKVYQRKRKYIFKTKPKRIQ